MFYSPEREREWEVAPVYGQRVDADEFAATILRMESHPEAAGYSDVGIRNLLYTSVLNIRPRRVLEVGLHIGIGAAIIAHGLKANGYGKLFSIEPNDAYRAIASQHLLDANLADYVTILPYFSYDAECQAILEAECPFDLIYIDADHTYAAALQDLNLMSTMLRDNGLMILHDVGRSSASFDSTGQGGVRRALNDFCTGNSA
jgi:predicted O-methyltransferase YrrM